MNRKERLAYKRKWISAKRYLAKRTKTLEHDNISPREAEANVNQSHDDQPGTSTSHRFETAGDESVVESDDCAVSAGDESVVESDDGAMSSDEHLDLDIHLQQWDQDRIDQHVTVSSDSGSDLDETANDNFQGNLVMWANECQVKHNAVDKLLKLLKRHGHPELPSTARALLGTLRQVPVELKSGMEYIYLGLAAGITKYLASVTEDATVLHISLNVDGLPLFRSSGKCMWPVLCAIQCKPVRVFAVALTYGASKPSNLDFLLDTVTELEGLLQNGLHHGGRIVEIKLKCIICDAPAKAFIKKIKLYCGYFGCDHCNQKGEWIGRITYQEIHDLHLRTNESFRNNADNEHHHPGGTPFSALPIDMVLDFPIDYMHACCLGVMKKMLLTWMRGPRATRLSSRQIDQISNRLLALQKDIPKNFARKPRSLWDIDHWKATEYRQFLLYSGKIVLKGILPDELYAHFLTLSVALCILVSPDLVLVHREYADELLVYFVARSRNIYGREFLIYNVHSLLHIASDAARHGSLDKFSAFCFENYLHQLKRTVRSGKSPLVQVVKRLHENDCASKPAPLPKLDFRHPDNAYLTDTGDGCELLSMANGEHGDNTVLCRVYNRIAPLFLEPCNSKIIGVLKADSNHTQVRVLPISSLLSKAILINGREERRTLFLRILHDVQY